MAINKNFVIKNGVEVNTNLLVGDSTLNKVGIATTVPGYTLHIGVGDGARGGIGATDITVTGIATIGVANSTSGALSVTGISTFDGLIDANGGVSARTAAVQDLTDNRVVIAGSGGELEDSANLTFDGSTLTVSGDLDPTNVSIGSTLQVAGVATFLSGVLVSGIGTFESVIDANGGINASSAKVEDLTSGRVVLAGTSGELEDSGNLTFDGTKLSTTAFNVSTGATIANNGNAAFAGLVTANGGIRIGTAVTVDSNTGNAAFTGIVTVGGNLVVGGDYSVDEISARNLNLTGIATIPTLGVTGIGTFEKLTVGTGVTLQEHGGVSIAGITTIGGEINAGSHINLPDAAAIKFGDSAEFQIQHTAGGATLMSETGSGNFEIRATNFNVKDSSQNNKLATNSLGIEITGDLDISGDLDVDDTTQSTSTTTGALKVDGGVGVVKNLNVGGETVLQAVRIAGVSTISDNVNISGVTTTGENLGGFKRLVGAASSTVVSIAVTVATKTTDHRYFDQGSTLGYWLDGVESPFLTLVPGKLYYFDQSHSTNSGHPLRFYLEQDKANAYATEITYGSPSPGSSGAYTQIGIGTASNENNHPAVLHYQCSAHALMGNAVATQSNAVNLPDSVVTTVRGNLMPGADSSYDIGASGTRFTNIYGDTLYGDGSNLTNLPTQVSIANNADNRVITGGSGVNLNGEANLTFDGSTLGITGSIDLSADIDVDGTANLDTVDVDGTANFADDVTLVAAGSSTILFDASAHSLIFQDNIRAKFGTDSDLSVYHDGGNSYVDNSTGDLFITNNNNAIKIRPNKDEESIIAHENGGIELFFNGTQTLFTTGIGITVGLTTLQRNGNAAFAGITTVGDILDVNGRIDAASGANISGIATITNAYIAKLAQSNGTSGNTNEVPVANGSGGWNWQPVNTTGAGDITGITVREEGSNVGTANSITILNFVGNDVTAVAAANQGICTVSVASSIAGISTLTTSFFHDIQQNGIISFVSSDQHPVINVGTAATIFKDGTAAFAGIVTANGGVAVGAAATVHANGNAGFAGIVTAGGGFNIGIQSAGIVIAKNVGISTLNFVGSGNSITYFAATNTLDVSIAGSSGGGGGGVSETETSVSSTSATSTGSFAKASFRSASILAQITQGSAYQVGRYLLIHDGTTVTTIEESAVATGSMLGTFEGVINGSNVEFRVTMSSSSSATVTTKIDTISIP